MTAYFVRNGGSDGADGLSDGNAWATVAKVNGFTFSPGDTISFKRGSLWREALSLNTARHQGTAGNPVTFNDYGSGALPRITGFAVRTGFTVAVGARYTASVATDPGDFVLEDGTPLVRKANTTEVENNAGSFFWTGGTLSVRSTDSADPDTHTMETVSTSEAFFTGGCDYVSLQNLWFDGGNSILAVMDAADHLTVTGCSFLYSKFILCWVGDGAATNDQTYDSCYFSGANAGMYLHGDNCTVADSTFYRVGRAIELRDITGSHCQNFLIEQSQFTQCGYDIFGATTGESNSGILLDGDTDSDNSDHHQGIIRHNTFTDLDARVIDGFFGDSQVIYNVIDTVTGATTGNGIEDNGPNNLIANNTLYNVENIGIFLNTDPIAPNVASVVRNNIVYGPCSWTAWSASGRGVTDIWSNNLYYRSSGNLQFAWDSAPNTYAQWVAAAGESGTISLDPQFTNAPAGVFSLASSSPAKNTGYFIPGVSEASSPDMGAIESPESFQVQVASWASVRNR